MFQLMKVDVLMIDIGVGTTVTYLHPDSVSDREVGNVIDIASPRYY
jgi:hypothetical protein